MVKTKKKKLNMTKHHKIIQGKESCTIQAVIRIENIVQENDEWYIFMPRMLMNPEYIESTGM